MENYLWYANIPVKLNQTNKDFMILVLGASPWSVIGIVISIIVGGKGGYVLLSAFGVVFFAAMISILSLIKKERTLKRILVIRIIGCLNVIFQLSLLYSAIHLLSGASVVSLLFVLSPILLVPFVLCLHFDSLLKNNKKLHLTGYSNKWVFAVIIICVVSIVFATLSLNLNAADGSIAAFASCVIILLSLCSIGLIDIQRLFYVFRYNLN